jgi:hypothetical protein
MIAVSKPPAPPRQRVHTFPRLADPFIRGGIFLPPPAARGVSPIQDQIPRQAFAVQAARVTIVAALIAVAVAVAKAPTVAAVDVQAQPADEIGKQCLFVR